MHEMNYSSDHAYMFVNCCNIFLAVTQYGWSQEREMLPVIWAVMKQFLVVITT